MTPEQLKQVEAAYQAAYRAATERAVELRRQRHQAIRQAAKEGMSTREIAGLLGLSFQRIAQITRR